MATPTIKDPKPGLHSTVCQDTIYFLHRRIPEFPDGVSGRQNGPARDIPGAKVALACAFVGLQRAPASGHHRLNYSASMVMHINLSPMADFRSSPPAPVFDIAGAGGQETFLLEESA